MVYKLGSLVTHVTKRYRPYWNSVDPIKIAIDKRFGVLLESFYLRKIWKSVYWYMNSFEKT